MDCPRSPMKQHPAGHMVLDYPEWARRTRTPQPESKPHVPVEDRRFNDDPEEYYKNIRPFRAISAWDNPNEFKLAKGLDPTEEFWANQ